MPEQQATYLTRMWGLFIGLIAGLQVVLFAVLGAFERGKVAGFSTAAILAAVRISWDYRKERDFWILIAAVVIAHIAIVFLVDWKPESKPALIFAPFAIADIFLQVLLYEAIAKKLGWKSNP